MTVSAIGARSGAISWRHLEWWGAAMGLFLQSGAVFALLLAGPDGEIADADRAKLRLLSLPVYAVSLALLARHPGPLIAAGTRNITLLALLALPVVSTLWSVAPVETLRRAIGLILSMALAYLLAIRFSPRQLLLLFGGLLGTLMVLSLAALATMPSLAMSPGSEMELRGVFIHKNVLGWAACLSLLLAAAMARDITRPIRRLGLALILPSALCLLLSQSATSLLAAFVGLAVMGALGLMARTNGMGRAIIVFILVQLAASLLLVLAYSLGPLLEALGKDATLTGRVPLWAEVDRAIAEHPVLGYGYQAFWSEGNLRVWTIRDTIGWAAPHAHNGYREMMLGLGIVGVVLCLILIVRALVQTAAHHCRAPTAGWLWMCPLVSAALVINLSESNLLIQNDLMTIVLGTIMVAAAYRRTHHE
ncbi:O-antigen ligase family protein [Acuticoccus kandeliae]|uniref:O-antigen ligase family protein n=1 Tax=Acuticoccus kandeliae TaxID=2073160 RepID=UPI001300587D|nr:O-antigen ligase family protein [Acuticoccus kandeliae]